MTLRLPPMQPIGHDFPSVFNFNLNERNPVKQIHRLFRAALLALVIPLCFSGCSSDSSDGSGGDSGGSDNSKFTGTWALSQGAGTLWYLIFNDDGSWLISDTADGSALRVFGTYSVDGNTAEGPMTNPGVGEGEIIAVLDGATLSLDFVEFWHSPPKHVPYVGTKL